MYARHGVKIINRKLKAARDDGVEQPKVAICEVFSIDDVEVARRLEVLKEWHARMHGAAGAAAIAALVQHAGRQDTHVACVCTACGAHGAVQRCAGCSNARYCDRKCQIKHWPNHKAFCKAASDARAAAAAVAASSSPPVSTASSSSSASAPVTATAQADASAAEATSTTDSEVDMTAGGCRRCQPKQDLGVGASPFWASLDTAGSFARMMCVNMADRLGRSGKSLLYGIGRQADGSLRMEMIAAPGMANTVVEREQLMQCLAGQLDTMRAFMVYVFISLNRDIFVQVASPAGWRQWRISVDKDGSIPDAAVFTESDKRLPVDLRTYSFKA